VGERYILFLRAESRPDLFPPVPDGAPRYALVGLNPDLAVVALEQDRIKSTGNSGIQARGGLLGELRAYDGKSVNNLVSDLTAFSSQANRAVMADMASRVAVDAAGNLFILDPGPGQVRKVTPTGAITTIVGTGTPGFSGDGGPAVAAQLKDPKDIAVDAAGNLYIADFSNARVRKVTPTGVITTIPGTEFRSDAGQGVLLFQPNAVAADSAGNLFVGYSARVKKVSSTGVVTDIAGVSPTRAGTLGRGDGGPALAAGLGVVDSVAVDRAGNILFGADGRIRAVTPGGTITTLVGTGSRGLGGDGGPAAAAQITRARCLFVDQDGNVFFCDETRVRKITAKGIITTVAGTGVSGSSGDGGPAIAAQLLPNGIAVDAAGNIFIADYGNHRVRKVTPDGIISTVAK
jgi:sugar lactone lactonase YvrE